MSLADELLADLEENDQDDFEEGMEVGEKEEEKPIIIEAMDMDTTQIHSVRELCKLRDSDILRSIINQIQSYELKTRKSTDIIGPVESDPEYQLIVEANNTAADIDNEIGISAC